VIPDENTTPMTWWQRVLQFEPARVRAILLALATVLAVFGLDATGVLSKVDEAWTALYAIIPLVLGEAVRRAVVPAGAVVEQVAPNGEVYAGPANDREPTGTVVRELGEATDADYEDDVDYPMS
jgi:hypothetical protein